MVQYPYLSLTQLFPLHNFLRSLVAVFILIAFTTPGMASGTASPSQQSISFDFSDDGKRQTLHQAAQIHREYLHSLPDNYQLSAAGNNYSKQQLLQSLEEFIALIRNSPNPMELSKQLKAHFTVIQAAGRKGHPFGEMLVTGYYEPLFHGSLSRKHPFIYPLYSTPRTITEQKRKGKSISYADRTTIETQDLLAGNELLYLKDPFEVFLLHVQGSGKVELQNGTIKSVLFDSHNGHKYKSIGKLLVDEGKLTLKKATVPAIRNYLDNNPEELTRVLHHNPRYIFFRLENSQSPLGSLGKPLTPGRSIAIDHKQLPTGLIGYLVTRKPVIDDNGAIRSWESMGRFVFPQDSGAAIKGSGRVDLFWGNGQYAEIAAQHMKEEGKLFFLIKKTFTQ